MHTAFTSPIVSNHFGDSSSTRVPKPLMKHPASQTKKTIEWKFLLSHFGPWNKRFKLDIFIIFHMNSCNPFSQVSMCQAESGIVYYHGNVEALPPTVDERNSAKQLRLVVFSDYLQGFIHPRWLLDFWTINSMKKTIWGLFGFRSNKSTSTWTQQGVHSVIF